MDFSARLRRWRSDAELSQRQVDEALGRRPGFINNYEAGRNQQPPDRATCRELGRVFDVEGAMVWDAACRDRLAALGPDFDDWFQGQYGRSIYDGPTTDPEREILDHIRWLDDAVPSDDEDGPTLAQALADVLLGLLVDAYEAGGSRRASDEARALVTLLRRLPDLPTDRQRAYVRAAVAVFEAVAR